MSGLALTSGLAFNNQYQWWIPAGGAAAPSTALTGTASQTVLATISIPANVMGPRGIIRVTFVGTHTNSGNNKTWSVRFGAPGAGTSGTAFMAFVATTSVGSRNQVQIHNAGAVNSQLGYTTSSNGWAITGGTTPTPGSIDTSAATEIAICGTLASSGETMTLISYLVEVAQVP